MNKAVIAGDATVISSHNHLFSRHGVNSVVLIQNGNLCIHTWPEFGYAACDFFTSSDTIDTWKSFEFLKEYLKS